MTEKQIKDNNIILINKDYGYMTVAMADGKTAKVVVYIGSETPKAESPFSDFKPFEKE